MYILLRVRLVFLLTLFACGMVPVRSAELELVGREMVRMLQNGHYARLPFNEAMSARFFERYLTTLDGGRIYFLQDEVADFRRRYERNLHDLISTKAVMPMAKEVFEAYRDRVVERVAFSRGLLEADEFSFENDREVLKDRSKAEWAMDEAGLRQLWRDSLDAMYLEELLERKELRARAEEMGKPDPFRNETSVRAKVMKKLERVERTVEAADKKDIANYLFSAIAKSYDPHSEYLSVNEMAQFRIDVSNELVGIGARLVMNDDGETVVKGLVKDGPADRGGELKLGDRVFAVSATNDGKWKDITFHPITKVIEHVLGEENSQLGLKVRRMVEGKDEVLDLVVSRGVVTIKNDMARARIFDYGVGGEPWKVAVMTIPSFYFDFGKGENRVSVHVEQLLERLKKEGVKGLVLDLRNNSGGSLPEVQRLTGFFVGRGPVVQVRSSNGQIRSLDSFHRKPLYDGPLVVMTNKKSASAAEILAGALQDYNRAVVIGASSTYGKGTVQKAKDISDYMPIFADRDGAGWLKLTFQKYYRVSGSSVQTKGVVPDLILPDLSDAGNQGEVSRKYALPHDVIRASESFEPRDRKALFLPVLRAKSAERLAGDPYFMNQVAEIKRMKLMNEEPTFSLKLETRLAGQEERRQLRKRLMAEQAERFAMMAEQDKKRFKVYRLSLDDLVEDVLPLDDGTAGADYMRNLEDEIARLTQGPKWPGGIDAVEREALYVLRDLLEAKEADEVAEADE